MEVGTPSRVGAGPSGRPDRIPRRPSRSLLRLRVLPSPRIPTRLRSPTIAFVRMQHAPLASCSPAQRLASPWASPTQQLSSDQALNIRPASNCPRTHVSLKSSRRDTRLAAGRGVFLYDRLHSRLSNHPTLETRARRCNSRPPGRWSTRGGCGCRQGSSTATAPAQ